VFNDDVKGSQATLDLLVFFLFVVHIF